MTSKITSKNIESNIDGNLDELIKMYPSILNKENVLPIKKKVLQLYSVFSYKRAKDQDKKKWRAINNKDFLLACLFFSLEKQEIPVCFSMFDHAIKIENKKKFMQLKRTLWSDLSNLNLDEKLGFVPENDNDKKTSTATFRDQSPLHYVQMWCEELNLSSEVKGDAEELYKIIVNGRVLETNYPKTIAASIIYFSSRKCGDIIDLVKLSNHIGIEPNTIKNADKKILKFFETRMSSSI